MNFEDLLKNIENAKNLKRKEIKNLVKLGEEILKLKEFQKPEIKNKYFYGIEEAKKILADNP